MVFSSAVFLVAFLPIVLLLYFITRPRYQNAFLLVASLLFYAYGEPTFVYIMVLSILLNYVFARLLAGVENLRYRRIIMLAAVTVNIGLLFFFKYFGFAQRILNRLVGSELFTVKSPALPIGISFFTFQALSYVIDVYRKKVPAQKSLISLALYISFFPQLIAGPIVRYNTIEKQIACRTVTLEKFRNGIKRFGTGFCKKVILANNVAVISNAAFSLTGEKSIALLWLGSVAFTLQIFFDFSGYSDMAIGLGKMFGFEFEENFNYPYISESISEFWRRWHMSLGQWFRDYVYIPLGGSRVSKPRNILNLLIVWLLTGIWHGANYTFIFWGGIQFAVQMLEKFLIHPEKTKFRMVRWIWRIVTLFTINFGWIVFNSLSLSDAKQYCISMFGGGNLPVLNQNTIYYLHEYGIYMLLGVLFSTPIMKIIGNKVRRISNDKIRNGFTHIQPVCQMVIFLWAVSFVMLGSYNPFIYFNF